MSRDMKPRPKPQSSSRGGTLMGVFVGLIIGAIIAAGLAWYFTRPNVFQSSKNPSAPEPAPAKPAIVPPEPIALPGKPGDKPVDKMKFDFYKLLPEGQDAVPPPPKEAPKADPAKLETRVETKPDSKTDKADSKPAAPDAPAAKPLAPGEKIWLQAGAFRDPVEADNMKARLAFQGVEAQVQKLDSADKPLYRVRVGPYGRLEDAESARGQLALAGMTTNLIRVAPKP